MYLRSQDILHVIFVLNGGGPVHLDLLLGLLLGLGFSKLYPKRHDALLCVCVLVTCNILVSSVSSLHWVRPGHTGCCMAGSPSRRVRETELGWRPSLPSVSCSEHGPCSWPWETEPFTGAQHRPLGDILTVPGHIHTSGAESYVCGDIYIWKYDP